VTDAEFDRCARCGALRRDHLAIVAGGADAALCPTATFRDPREAGVQDNDELRALMADDVSSPPRPESR
jgi:hypothetical protein